MTLKKLAAGSGYEYLTRQVAAADSTELGRTKLADYYSAKGEAPGLWMGSGLVGIKDLEHGDVVTAEQMKNLFGEGCDPVTGAALGRRFRADGVAGFDLTFSPVKSVSTLWAVAPPEVAKAIERAHADAVADAITFLEQHAIFTREGTDGVRQVETRGLIGAAFTHRDSRAGDPDLHTHVAVANKVQTREGKWLSIYGTVLHRYVVAASETYNTALEHRLSEALGVQFVDTPAARGKRPIREIDGVDPLLCALWSRRRADIEDRLHELEAEFTASHGGAPTAKESIRLAQHANLDTRAPKHEPRSEAEQRAEWQMSASIHMGRRGLGLMIEAALNPDPRARQQVTSKWIAAAAERVIAELEVRRATWQSWHLYAEAQRQVRDVDVPADQVAGIVEHVVDTATRMLINLTPDRDPIAEPAALRRSDGTSVYRHTGADNFTTQRLLDSERRIVAAAGRRGPLTPDPDEVELTLMQVGLEGLALNTGQHDLVRDLLSDPAQVALALAPAGSGKTTAMNALAETALGLGLEPAGLAPSAAAAAVLTESTGMQAETPAMLDHALASGIDPGFGPHTVVIIDEAGMADTLTLDRVITACTTAGARVRLIGDDQQLAAVGAGGVLRDIATTHRAVRLKEVIRFADPIEAKASTDLRAGDRAALGFYLDHDRVHAGDTDSCVDDVLTAWTAKQAAGQECLMLAPTRELVARLNHAASATRLDSGHPAAEVELPDGNRASTGDTILTRRNDRRIGASATDWVRNGDRWTVTDVRTDGSIQARHLRSGLKVVLPASYVAEHVELGYATTVHAAQGSTADVMHGIVTGAEDRQFLYTMLTRGRAENHVHVVIDQTERNDREEQFLPEVDQQLTATEILDRIVDRDGSATSATTTLAHAISPANRLHEAAERHADAVATATHRLLGSGADDALEATGPGPLPWLPGIPADLREDTAWADYLAARAARVTTLAEAVRCETTLPPALARYGDILTPDLRNSVIVWRAATGVPDTEPTLFGPRPTDPGAAAHARRLQRQVNDLYPPSVRRWEAKIAKAVGHADAVTLDLARELDVFEKAGGNAGMALARALRRGPLPDDHATEALAYRVRRLVTQSRVTDPFPRQQQSPPSQGLGL